ILLLISFFYLIRQLINKFSIFRWQAGLMVSAILVPFLTSIFFVTGILNFRNYDLTPLGLFISSIIFIYGISRKKLGDIIPIRYSSIISSMADSIIVIDKKGRILFLNKNAKDNFLKTKEELIGRKLLDVFPELKSFFDEDFLIKNYKKENITKNSYSKNTKDLGNFNVKVSDYKNPSGKNIGYIIVLRDISEKIASDNLIKKSEQKFRNIFSNSLIGITLYNKNFQIVDANEAAMKIFGVKDLRSAKNYSFYSKNVSREKLMLLNKGETFNYEAEFDFDKAKETGLFDTDKSGKIFLDILISQVNIDGPENDGYLVHTQDITQKKQIEENIRYLSFHDKLTGLYNRAYFEEELMRLDSGRHLPLGFIIGDVNGLKLINDSFGHLEGDKLLINIGNLLKNTCRKDDIVARWGGDEFAILLPQTSEELVLNVANRIYEKCLKFEKKRIPLSISLGYNIKNENSQDMQKIIIEAEDRMYKRKMLESQSVSSSILTSLKSTLWEKSHETEEHALRMHDMALKLGHALNLSSNQLDDLALFATLHDIGKIGVSDKILLKIGILDDEEWKTMKKHPEIGFRISQSTPQLICISEYILTHHESWNGTGYPKGLKGNEIPLLSRIITLIDAFDVMMHERPYKKAVQKDEAIKEIIKCSGIQFDPGLVGVFLNILKEESIKLN
ncbi:MAG: diguanylate cyclase domain-containing protein, partial [Candidatus Humimicrobiaceae bacterium]